MASLTDKRIKNTYDGLLKTTDNDALGGSYKLITDGLGNSSNVYLGTGGNVGIGASPSTKLHITDDSDSIIRIQRTGSHDLQLNSDGTITATSTDIKLVASSYISFTADFSEHMRVTGLGNVGIGTDSPGAKLHVSTGNDSNSGNIEFVIGGTNLSNARTASLIKNTSSPYELTIQSSNNPTGSSHLIFKTSGSDERMRIRSDGNVGIGTTTPGAKLEVAGAVGNFQTTGHQIFLTRNGNNEIYAVGASSVLALGTNSAEKMRIDSSGNVGIGTTDFGQSSFTNWNNLRLGKTGNLFFNTVTNTYGFSIGRNFYFASDANYKYLTTDEAESIEFSAGNINFKNATSGTEDNNLSWSTTMRIDSSGNVGIGTVSPSQKLEIRGETATHKLVSINRPASDVAALYIGNDSASPSNGIISSNYSDLIFGRDQSSVLTEHMRIKRDGNVGIGTTSPFTNLTIYGATDSRIALVNSNTGTTSSDGFVLIAESDSDVHFLNREDSDMFFSTNGSKRMTILSAGNVGIGTTSPAKKLHVEGEARINNNASNIQFVGTDHVFLEFYPRTISSGRKAYLGYAAHSTTNFTIMNQDTGGFIIGTNNSEKLRILSTGNVGIGTTNPLRPLHINGAGTNFVAEFQSTDDKASILIQDDDTLNYIHSQDGYLSLGGQNALSADNLNINSSNGNVGIGTDSPNTKLDVRRSSNGIALELHQNSGSANDFVDMKMVAGNTSAGNFGTILRHARQGTGGGDFAILTNPTLTGTPVERLRVTNAGNVGIGTTSPSAKLDIRTTSDQAIFASTNGGYNALEFTSDSGTTTGSLIAYNNTIRLGNASAVGGWSNGIVIDSTGQVGIGTSSPGSLLSIATYAGTGHINESTLPTTPDKHLINLAPPSTLNYFGGGISWSEGTNTAASINAIDNGSGGALGLILSTGNNTSISERMRIDSSGNVGIGTTNPGVKLDVNGAIRLLGTGTDNDSNILYFTNGAAAIARDANDLELHAYDNIIFGVSNTSYPTSTERMRIDSSGNVGIGTTSPADKLHVYSNDSSTIAGLTLEQDGTGDSVIQYLLTGIKRWVTGIDNSDGDKFKISHNTNLSTDNVATFTADNRVGIGTTSPNTTLEVGDCDSSNNIADGNIAVKTNTNDTAIVIQEASGAEQWGLGVNVDGDLIFTDSGTERIRFDDGTGRVGIGTGAPAVKLHTFEANDNWIYVETSGTNAIGGLRTQSSTGSRQNTLYRNVTTNLLTLRSGTDDGEIQFIAGGDASERMRIAADGGLFVYDLLGSSASNPDVRYNTTTGELYYNSSSIRYKEDITDIESTIDKINKLRPVKFKVKESQQYTTGLIAEEVVEVIPEIVFEREIEGFDKPQIDGVAYNDLHAYYIKAIQEQQEMINELKTEIQTLKSQINS